VDVLVVDLGDARDGERVLLRLARRVRTVLARVVPLASHLRPPWASRDRVYPSAGLDPLGPPLGERTDDTSTLRGPGGPVQSGGTDALVGVPVVGSGTPRP